MRYSAKVIRGQGRGKQLGFPTFNLEIPPSFDYKFGVYGAKVWLEEQELMGALHFGTIPTFGQKNPVLEIHVLDYNGDQPFREISFEPLEYLRDIRQFPNPKELSIQVSNDVLKIRELLKKS
jgi:riboflavin kinase/FMN adenylyltransferase